MSQLTPKNVQPNAHLFNFQESQALLFYRGTTKYLKFLFASITVKANLYTI